MNDRIGEFPVPPPREVYLPDATDTRQSHPIRTMSDVLQPRTPLPPRSTSDRLEQYREVGLADSASEPTEIDLGQIPIAVEGAIVAWLANAIDHNPIHAQLVLDAAEKLAKEAGIPSEEFTEIARHAITKFAHDRGRF